MHVCLHVCMHVCVHACACVRRYVFGIHVTFKYIHNNMCSPAYCARIVAMVCMKRVHDRNGFVHVA